MRIDPDTLAARDTYKLMIGLITPRPIAWVSTVSDRGITNLAPFSFFSGVSAAPPTVVFSCVNRRDGTKKDTLLNIEQVPQFVVNVATHPNREAINLTAAELPYGQSEIDTFGLQAIPSERVRPPRVKEAPVQMECELHQIVTVGDGPLAAHLVIGRIVLIHADDRVFTTDGAVDPRALDTIGRMGGTGYARTTDLFNLVRPGPAGTTGSGQG